MQATATAKENQLQIPSLSPNNKQNKQSFVPPSFVAAAAANTSNYPSQRNMKRKGGFSFFPYRKFSHLF